MPTRKFDTCFFERYARISLSALLRSEFDGLVNLGRPNQQRRRFYMEAVQRR